MTARRAAPTRLFPRLLTLAAAGCLSACVAASNDTTVGVGSALDSVQGRRAHTERRLATEALDAIAAGKTAEALLSYEKLYKRSPRNREVAVNYAQLLRKSGRPEEALAVLRPFAEAKTKDKDGGAALVKNEYAATLIALGRFEEAQAILDGVLTDARAAAFHADASHLAGIALDAQGHHKAAEKLFRQALDGWNGDPTSVMNNLALNLASQGKFDESLNLLRKAQLMSPEKTEIARNVQIVNDLREAVVPTAPVNIRKN